MKKYMTILLALVLLTACQGKTEKPLEENQVAKENVSLKEKTSEEILHKITFNDEHIIEFNQMEIYLLNKDLSISASSLIPYKLNIAQDNLDDYIQAISGLKYENSKDMMKSEPDSESLFIKFNDGEYIELIENKPYHSDNLYYYNYYKNDELESVLTSEYDLKARIFEIEIENRIKSDVVKDWFPKENNPVLVYSVNLVDRFYEDMNLILLANVLNDNYSFKDGIFTSESGFAMPMEIRYSFTQDKNKLQDSEYELSEIILAKDGSLFADSLKEMSRGNQEIYNKLMDSQNSFAKNYDRLMRRLAYLADKEGLENFSHDIEKIPGYEEDVIYIESGPNHIAGTVEIAKKADYEKAKKNENNENWPHCDGVLYHKETGIAVKSIVDYFE